MRTARRRLPLVAVALAAAASACACRPAPRSAEVRPNTPAVVVFTNQSLYEAAVYAIGDGGLAVRIGTVSSGRTDTLALRSAVSGSGSVTIVARLLARRGTPSTGALTLWPGDRIAVTLPATANILSVLPAGG